MVEQINTWLDEGCDYALGVSLYDRYGASSFFKNIFKKGESPTNRQKLNELLIELRDSAPAPEPVPVIIPAAAPAHLPAAHPDQPAAASTGNALTLLKVIGQRKQSFANIQLYHPQLTVLPEGEALRELADFMVREGKKNAELWVRQNHLTEHPDDAGDEMQAPPPPVMIDLNLINEKERIRKSLGKAKARIEGNPKPPQKTLDLIKRQEQALADIKARIEEIRKGGAQ